jgi:hypothetical protein
MVKAGLNEIISTFILLGKGPCWRARLDCRALFMPTHAPTSRASTPTRLLIMLNLLSRFNKAWRLTSVRHFIVCSSSGLNVEVEWRAKVSIILYRNINISQTKHNLNIYTCWFDITADWKRGKIYKESPSASDTVAINFLKKLISSSYLTWNMKLEFFVHNIVTFERRDK